MSRMLLISVSVIALMVPRGVNATETVTYSYDAQGRLVQSVISGTVNNGQSSSTTFDAANNRTNYSVSLSGGTPPQPNTPPVSVADEALSVICSAEGVRNVLGNDTDPENDLPLSMQLTGGSGLSYVAQEGAQSIRFYAPPTRIIGSSFYTVTYTITDARGATTSASLSLRVGGSSAQCGGGPAPLQAAPPAGDGQSTGGSGGG